MLNKSFRQGWQARVTALAAIMSIVGVRADAEDPVITTYRERQAHLVDSSRVVLAQADAEKRELTTEERKTIRDNSAEVERLEDEITLRNSVSGQNTRLAGPAPSTVQAGVIDPPQQRGTAMNAQHVQTTNLRQPNTRAQGNHGFRSIVDFSVAVMAAARGQGLDPRLHNAALSTYGNESSGADGGFAVPPDFRSEIMALVTGEESMFSRVDAIPTASNSVTVPVDETTAWGTSGVRVYSRAEAGAMTQSKPALKDITVRLNEIYALVPLTDELLEDAPMLARLVTSKAGEALNFKLTDYIINGTGSGQPLGIMNSGALVTASKESSQAAASIHALNIAKMWARMPARARAGAVWLMNQDCESMMMELGFQVQNAARNSATGGIPLYMPPGGLSALPYATLLGKPVLTTEACATLGTTGDIILASLPGYFLPYKAGGIKEAVSMHLWFDQAMTAFRWTFRFGGQPWLSAPIARKNGSNTLSTFVALETR
jgi:HK97 family phage major capsid protein